MPEAEVCSEEESESEAGSLELVKEAIIDYSENESDSEEMLHHPVRLLKDRKESSEMTTWVLRIVCVAAVFIFGRASTSFISSAKSDDIESSRSMWLDDLEKHSIKHFSQQGQDGIIEWVFDNIGTTNKYFVGNSNRI